MREESQEPELNPVLIKKLSKIKEKEGRIFHNLAELKRHIENF